MNIYSLTSLAAFFVCFFLSLFVYKKGKTNPVNKHFAIATICMGTWCLFPFVASIITDEARALFGVRLVYLSAFFTPSTFLHFILILLGVDRKRPQREIIIGSYIASLGFFIVLFNPAFIKGVVRFTPSFSVVPGPLYVIFVLFFGLLCSYTVYGAFISYQKTSGYKKNQLRYLFIGFVFAFIGGIMHFLAAYVGKEPFPHDFLIIGYSLIMAYAIVKYNLMSIDVVFKELLAKILSFAILTVACYFSVIYVLKIANVTDLQLTTIFAIFAMAIFYSFHKKLNDKISHFLRPRPDFSETFRRSAETQLIYTHNVKELADVIVKTINDSLNPRVCSLMLIDRKTGFFNIVSSAGKDEEIKSIAFKESNHLISALRNSHGINLIVRDELGKILPDETANLVRRDLEILNAQICLPLKLKGELVGVLNLGNKQSGELYTPEEMGFIFAFTAQSTMMLRFLEEIAEFEKKLIQAEKLTGMTNLLVGFNHEIRNQLNNMQLPITPGVDSFVSSEDLEKARQTAQESSNTIVMILDAVQDYHENCEVSSRLPMDIKSLIEEALIKLKPKFDRAEIKITTNLAKNLPQIEAHPTFNYLFFNLLTNCYFGLAQSVVKTPLLDIKTRQTKDPQRPLEIVIADTGGDTLKVMQRDTQSSGGEDLPERSKIGGINFFLAKHIIEDHKGELIVTTNPPPGSGELPGTVFTIRLPLTQPKEMS